MDIPVDSIPEPVLVYKDSNETIPYSRIVVPSSMRSPLWRFFGFPADDNYAITNRKKIVCTICRTQIAYNKNTTNLSTHLHCKHPSVYAKLYPTAHKRAKHKTEHRPDAQECGVPVKRCKTDDDVDWHVDEHTQIDQSTHPTGIRVKEAVRRADSAVRVLQDEHAKPPGIKKSMTLDENFELVITAEDADNDSPFIETLDYNEKDYMELVNDDCGDMMSDAEHLAEDSADAEKSEFLVDELLASPADQTCNGAYERQAEVPDKTASKCGLLRVKVDAVLQATNCKPSETEKTIRDTTAATTDQLKRFIVRDIVSPSMLDGAGFRELIKSLARSANMPTATEARQKKIR